MPPRQVVASRTRVEGLLKQTPAFGEDAQALSHWARYLCVVVAGHLEECVRQVLISFSETKADRRVHRYAAGWLEGLTNLNPERVRQVLGAFDAAWGREIESFMKGARAEALGSILANRHNIAHGRPSDITLARLREWYGPTAEVLWKVEQLCG